MINLEAAGTERIYSTNGYYEAHTAELTAGPIKCIKPAKNLITEANLIEPLAVSLFHRPLPCMDNFSPEVAAEIVARDDFEGGE
jgi:hypothetical protein